MGGFHTTNRCQVSIFPIEADESAVCSLPLRFTISSFLLTALLLISCVSIYDFLDGVKEREVLDEVSKLTAAADQLSLRGEGSELTLDLNLPQGTSVEFGALPGRQDKWPVDANNYCVRIGEKTAFYSSDAFFSNPELNGPVSFGSGKHRLLLSTKTKSGSGGLFITVSKKN
jgi:hypothetical protein